MRLAAIILTLTLASSATALTFLGPPSTTMRAGQIAIGGRYGSSEQDIEIDHVSMDDVEWDTFLLALHAGLATERAEIYGLVGVSDVQDWRGTILGIPVRVQGDDELAVGIGGRVTTNRGENLSWGIVGQILWWEVDELGVDADMYDIQIGLGPAWRSGPVLVYGGPMWHFVEGQVEILNVELDIEAESTFGGYIGAGYEILPSLMLMGEYQATPDAEGFGAAVRFEF